MSFAAEQYYRAMAERVSLEPPVSLNGQAMAMPDGFIVNYRYYRDTYGMVTETQLTNSEPFQDNLAETVTESHRLIWLASHADRPDSTATSQEADRQAGYEKVHAWAGKTAIISILSYTQAGYVRPTAQPAYIEAVTPGDLPPSLRSRVGHGVDPVASKSAAYYLLTARKYGYKAVYPVGGLLVASSAITDAGSRVHYDAWRLAPSDWRNLLPISSSPARHRSALGSANDR